VDRRLGKIERILAVQKQLHRLAEWDVAALDRKKAELTSGQAELVAALNDHESLQGIFIDAMARRLAALAREADKVSAARAVMAERLTEAGLKLKRTERITGRLRREREAALGKRGFADLLDLLARPDKASFP
jgi:hypothetical protein